jgi:hypothetical protein
MRYFCVTVRPDPSQANVAQGYIEAEDEVASRAMLLKLDGLLLFDHSAKCASRAAAKNGRRGVISSNARAKRRDYSARKAIERQGESEFTPPFPRLPMATVRDGQSRPEIGFG